MIWLEISECRARAIDGVPEDRPPYRALGIVNLYGQVAVMSGLLGRVRPEEVRAFYRELLLKGCRWLLAERVGGRKLPYGVLVEEGPFAGWWQVDLSRFDDEINDLFNDDH